MNIIFCRVFSAGSVEAGRKSYANSSSRWLRFLGAPRGCGGRRDLYRIKAAVLRLAVHGRRDSSLAKNTPCECECVSDLATQLGVKTARVVEDKANHIPRAAFNLPCVMPLLLTNTVPDPTTLAANFTCHADILSDHKCHSNILESRTCSSIL